jgi:hypothetical protein
MTGFTGRAPRWLPALAALAIGAVACATGRPAPAAALAEYSAALSSGDYAKAYAMMSDEFRRAHSKEEFVRMMRDNPDEVRETAVRLRGPFTRVEMSAELRYGIGDQLRLVQEGGRWRIASDPLAFYSQSTPRDALRSFVRAYRLKRWDMMMRLIPTAYRERMTADKVRAQFQASETVAMMNMLEANVEQPIQEKGTDARMPYGSNLEVEFVREDGLWKIKDPD